MKFIGYNRDFDDCMIVAIHNALIGLGKKSEYSKVRDIAIKKGWYKPGLAFNCSYLNEALSYFKLSCRPAHKRLTTKGMFRRIRKENKVFMFLRPSGWSLPGHAMVAAKSERGVKVHNPYECGTGWKTLSRNIRKGETIYAFEIMRSA